MSGLFNRLPGPPPVAPGMERRILRALPAAFAGGSVLFASIAAIASRWDDPSAALLLFHALGALLFHWNASIGVGIAAFIVMVMKGPAYVADPYPLDDAEPGAADVSA